jgi:CRP-like cAMP-binding protein
VSSEGQDVITRGAAPARAAHTRGIASPRLHAYILDADDDLAQEFDVRMRFAARQLLTARVLDTEPGECELSPSLDAAGSGPGLLILDGLLAADTRVAERTVTELLGAGDLLQPPCRRADEMIEQIETWRALRPTRLAVLDAEFAERARPWPQVAHALLRRTERRASDLSAVRAISCQPKLELRLVLFLWHLAGRWGRVEPAGLRLSLPLTHRLLGQLVGAERPSISHALRRLASAGVVTGSACDLHLHGALEAHLNGMIEHAVDPAQRQRRRRPGHPANPLHA